METRPQTRFHTNDKSRNLLVSKNFTTLVHEFNTSAILRADKAAQGAFWKDMANVGAATPNEIRREIGMSRIENGDEAFVQVNVMTLKNAVKEKMIEGNQE